MVSETMKQFKFTLQAMWDLTISAEEQLKMQMQKNEETLVRLKYELDSLEKARMKAKQAYIQNMQKGMQADMLKSYTSYIDEYNLLINKQKAMIERVEMEKQRLVAEKIRLYKELKKLQSIRDKQYAEYLTEVKNEEEKEMGDIISYKIATN